MVARYKDPTMQEVIRRTLRAAMAESGDSYQDLANALERAGVHQSESTLRTKVTTGIMTTSLYLHILNALKVDSIDVGKMMNLYNKLRQEGD